MIFKISLNLMGLFMLQTHPTTSYGKTYIEAFDGSYSEDFAKS